MPIFKGGPGKKAPYQTKLSRIPVAANEAIDTISRVYKTLIVRGDEEEAAKFLDAVVEIAMQFYSPDLNSVNKVKDSDNSVNKVADEAWDEHHKLVEVIGRWQDKIESKEKGWKTNSASQLCRAIQDFSLPDKS